jgi:hypothetical protein
MDGTRYVQILCGVCGGKTLAIRGLSRPTECGLCKAPFEDGSSEARPTDPAVRGVPTTFTRGTFTNLQTQRPRTGPAPRPSAGTQKPSSGADSGDGGLKEKLIRLFNPRS